MYMQMLRTMQSQPNAPLSAPLFCAIDFPAFIAQVISAYHAQYRNTAFVVISQNAHSHKSTVVSCSSPAMALGVEYNMPLHVIQRRWPRIGIVQRDKDLEIAACEEIGRVLDRYSPQYGVRENGSCIINLSRTPSQRTLPILTIAKKIRDNLTEAVPVQDIAVGMAGKEAMARIMARMARPRGVCMCENGLEEPTLQNLDVAMLPGLSGPCRIRLAAYGIKRIGQIQAITKEALVVRFGNEGEKLYSLAHGSAGRTQTCAPARYCEETILDKDINDAACIMKKVRLTVDKLCFSLKNTNTHIDRYTMTICYSDNKKSKKTIRLPHMTNDFVFLSEYAQRAFTTLYVRRVALRSIRIEVKNPQPDPCQTSLFETSWEQKQAALTRQIVKIRNKNSFDAVLSGADITPVRPAQKA